MSGNQTKELNMLYKLHKDKYMQLIDLVHPTCLSLQLETVLRRSSPGFVYVDDLTTPTAAVVYHQGEDGFYIIGTESTGFIKSIENNMSSILENINHKLESFEFSGDHESWHQAIMSGFENRKIHQSIQRLYFNVDPNLIDDYPVAKDYEIRDLASSLEDDTLLGKESVLEPISKWWHSTENYLAYKIGTVAIKDDTIIGHCVLDGKIPNSMGVGIAVDKAHRNKGLASALASRTVNQILSHNQKVYWECMDENIGSQKLAEKCGLKHTSSYQLYWFDL
jgi:GNAT superfamily N-acetyltransferase